MEENEELKIGAMISRSNMTKLQAAHDALSALGVACKSMKSIDLDDSFILFGDDVKVLSNDEQGVKVGGHLVRFGDAYSPDISGKRDYFTKDTNFGLKAGERKRVPVFFNHAMPLQTEDKKYIVIDDEVGDGEIWMEDTGVLIEAILYNRKEYEKAIAGQYKSLGWSSGTMGHVMQRVPQPNGTNWVKRWIIGEGSVTPTPAEPRKENNVIPLKSLTTPEAAATDNGELKTVSNLQETIIMETNEIKALFDEQKTAISALVKNEAEAAATKAVADVLDKLPEVKAKMNATVEVTRDEADTPFKSLGENLSAIAKFATKGESHPRIRGLKAMEFKAALGSNEAIPSQGEFLLEPTITRTLLQNIHESGVFTQDVQRLPVGPNSNSGWIPGIDETSRVAGSRWGGVRGYHAAEAASMTASQPKFRKINWELHKAYVLQYATDEVLNDVGMLNTIIQKSSMEELDFMANYDVLLGIGGDRPVGVLQSSALISVSRAATSAVAHADIVSMWARMLPRSKSKAKWYISSDVHAQLDQLTFTSGSTGILSPYVSYGNDGVMRIYGRPVVETEFNPALGTAGDILLADMSEYLYWEKNAVEAASSIHVQFLTDQTAFRFIYRYDGQTALASAITPANGSSNTQSPFVTLLATT